MGFPIYDFTIAPDFGGVCRVYIKDKCFLALYSGSKKRGRRNAASVAMFSLFGVCTAILIADVNPQLPYVHFIPKEDRLSDKHQSTLLNTECRILIVGDSGVSAGARVSRYSSLEAAVRELTY